MKSDNVFQRYKAGQFIRIITDAKPITEFDVDLYLVLVEKMTAYDGGRIIVSLLDGTEVSAGILDNSK